MRIVVLKGDEKQDGERGNERIKWRTRRKWMLLILIDGGGGLKVEKVLIGMK